MHEFSRLAPRNPTGPGTSPGNPFRTQSILHGYNLLDVMHFQSQEGSCKVRYERIGSNTHPNFPHPIDHYILFEGEMGTKETKGKLMDFYIYGYSDHPHDRDDLPAGLLIRKFDDETRKQMKELVESTPALKRIMEQQTLMRINMARLQRGLPPLDRLPQKGACLLVLLALVAGVSALGWTLTQLAA
ncbi:MAG: hypothetical protein RL495_1067 [Verrucomicrobiota bacterium]|jgi:hypothetical protein